MRSFASLGGRSALVLAIGLAGVLAGPFTANTTGANPTNADEVAQCAGRDLLTELGQRDREAVDRIEKAAARTANGEALLWRISGKGIRPSHLFGTIHLSDERVRRLTPATSAALAGAERLVLEVADLSPAALGGAMGRLSDQVVFADGRSLAKMLSAEEFAAAKTAALRAGLPEPVLSIAKPWLVSMLLAVSDCERGRTGAGIRPLDLELEHLAKSRGLPVSGLESLEDQLRAMAAVPEADQLIHLRASLKLHARAEDAVETIVRRYLARETAKVWPLQQEIWRAAGFDPVHFTSFQRELVSVRNRRMRDGVLPVLREGAAFVAVGALHLIGEDGLVALLRKAGYSVTAIE